MTNYFFSFEHFLAISLRPGTVAPDRRAPYTVLRLCNTRPLQSYMFDDRSLNHYRNRNSSKTGSINRNRTKLSNGLSSSGHYVTRFHDRSLEISETNFHEYPPL